MTRSSLLPLYLNKIISTIDKSNLHILFVARLLVFLACDRIELFRSAIFATATSDEEMTMWVQGLTSLVTDTLKSPTPLQIER